MIKQVQFFGKTAAGVHVQPLFGEAGALVKTAGAQAFADWSTGAEIRNFISKISAQDRKENLYVLVNALGAGEFYGSNINADYFPWDALAHKGHDYGYETFLNGHAFQHHVNKDPTRAFGQPVLSILNHDMRRVELIVKLNKAKAEIENAGGVISRIEAGEFPDVSMGCKVPFDLCYICNNSSKTKDDYCQHMRPPDELRHIYGPNKILPNGQRCCVINTLPRFFDISFVFIGADKTAKVMAKLASKKTWVCLGDICTVPRPSAEVADLLGETEKTASIEKTASCDCDCGGVCEGGTEKLAAEFGVKKAAQEKLSEILKSIPAGPFSTHTLPALEKNEPNIPANTLNRLGEEFPVGASCSLLGHLGIVLKPQEFQRIVLVRMGSKDLADKLDHDNAVFKPSSDISKVEMSDSTNGLDRAFEMLKGLIKDRTAFGQQLTIRIMVSNKDSNFSLPTQKTVEDPLLDKIGAAYNGYRQNLLVKLSQVRTVVENDPKLREAVLGESIADMFTKSAQIPAITLDSMAYMLGAHMTDRSLLCNTATAEAMAATDPSLLSILESDLA